MYSLPAGWTGLTARQRIAKYLFPQDNPICEPKTQVPVKKAYLIPIVLLTCTFLGLGRIGVQGQDLSTISQQKPVTLSGGLNVRTIFYQANGIENRRQPFSYVITGAPVLSIYGITVPVSFVFSEQERSFRQPFNQFGLSPTYKWLTVHAGYRNITFSPYTLAGHTMLGAGVEMSPGLFRFGFMYGRLNRATAVDTTSGSLEPFSYTRRGYAVRAGIGKPNRYLDFSLIKARDDSTSADVDRVTRRRVTPAENVVFGLSSRITFLKKFYWEGDGGLSFYTQNINSAVRLDSLDLLPAALVSTLGQFIRVNGSTEFYSAYQTGVGYRGRGFGLKLQYRRVDPRYQSMGAYFFNNDLENITISPSLTLLNQRLRFSGSLGVQRDNLQNQKQATSRRVIGSANLSADITERLGLDLNFTNFSTNQRARTILLADSFLLAQTTRNLSLTPRYLVAGTNVSHVFLFSFNRMTLADQNAWTTADNSIQSNTIFFNYQVNFNERDLNLSLNLNSTRLQLATGINANEGVTAGVTKRILERKLLVGFNSSVLRGNQGQGSSLILNNGFRADLQAGNMHRFNALLNFIGNYPDKPSGEPYHTRFTEFRGEIGYTLNF
jgi:hypothetical protein